MAEITLESEIQTLIDTYGQDEVVAAFQCFVQSEGEQEGQDDGQEEETQAPPAKGKKVVVVENHTCEATVNTKTDGAKICGKNARNEHNGMWFCGTEKSGHYKSAITAAKKEPVKKAAPTADVKKVPAAKGADAKAKTTALVQKVVKKEKLDLHVVTPGSGVYVDLKHHRITFDKPSQEAYGILDEDNVTILPLTEEAIAFLQAHNIAFRQDESEVIPEKPVAKPKAPAKPAAVPTKAPVKPAVAAKPAAPAKPAAAKPAAVPAKPAAPVKAPAKPAAAPVKAPAKPVVPTKAPAKPAAPAAKPPAKPAAPAKAPAKPAAPAKGVKPKIDAPTTEDEEMLDQLKQDVEDAVTEVDETEPDAEEVQEDVQEEADVVEAEIDLGADEEEPAVEEEADVGEEAENGEESPDLEEVDEGEAAEDEGEEEVEVDE